MYVLCRNGGGGGGAADDGPIDRESQESVDREKAAQEVLQAQLEELVSALKASSLLVHSSLRQQNLVKSHCDIAIDGCNTGSLMIPSLLSLFAYYCAIGLGSNRRCSTKESGRLTNRIEKD